ncbi:MAG: 2-oxoglutarate dehydrogenase complex dihydrolipoyllysine-residue succinyltransferase [Candidatus Promineifilaceae bacterium]|nr:2-oxoglutarate dehydrogenase complex dihydrolipoyllysine-residue succinyltransferase [Candidatus Promineifilaceae bacterium]
MSSKIKVPDLGESVVEATVGEWHKEEGESVGVGDVLVELETDKVDIEVGAETAGVLRSIRKQTGEDVRIGETLGEIEPDGASGDGQEKPEATAPTGMSTAEEKEQAAEKPVGTKEGARATPVAARMAKEEHLDLEQIEGSGAGGRITREDVELFLGRQKGTRKEIGAEVAEPERKPEAVRQTADSDQRDTREQAPGSRREERIRMSRRRRTIARRLVEAQQSAAMLTTFNDVDMSAVINLRKRRGEAFKERHGVKLGFMSFFVKSVVGALKAFPRLNAEIDGDEMVLKHYYNLGIAVGAEEGLVVPVVRDADRKSFAAIEQEILDLAQKARQGSLTLEDLRGGTFTITNGGIFGSMLSTPILNTPEVGILGMHRIEERPLAVDGEVVIRPMMYLALSYDHRLVDGREAVQFLVRVKELIEEPETLLLEG